MSALGLAEAFDSAVRSKDLGDLIDTFARYEEEGDRRFELFDVSIDTLPLQFEEAGAYLLGADVAGLAAPKTRSVIQEFLAGLTDEYSRPIGQVLAEERRTGSDDRRAEVWRLFRVFREGFERH